MKKFIALAVSICMLLLLPFMWVFVYGWYFFQYMGQQVVVAARYAYHRTGDMRQIRKAYRTFWRVVWVDCALVRITRSD